VQLQRAGEVERAEMFKTFNMGVGMVVIVAESEATRVRDAVIANGVQAWRLGDVRPGSGQVILN
jgi:phosphoribosylformylglycinamidine cyclo-ligase